MTQGALKAGGFYQAIGTRATINVSVIQLTDMDAKPLGYPLNRFGDDAAAGFVRVIKSRGHLVASGD